MIITLGNSTNMWLIIDVLMTFQQQSSKSHHHLREAQTLRRSHRAKFHFADLSLKIMIGQPGLKAKLYSS